MCTVIHPLYVKMLIYLTSGCCFSCFTRVALLIKGRTPKTSPAWNLRPCRQTSVKTLTGSELFVFLSSNASVRGQNNNSILGAVLCLQTSDAQSLSLYIPSLHRPFLPISQSLFYFPHYFLPFSCQFLWTCRLEGAKPSELQTSKRTCCSQHLSKYGTYVVHLT